jgi:hypothetical protein
MVPPKFVTLFFSGKCFRSSGEFGPDSDGIGQHIDGIVKNGSLPAGWVRGRSGGKGDLPGGRRDRPRLQAGDDLQARSRRKENSTSSINRRPDLSGEMQLD